MEEKKTLGEKPKGVVEEKYILTIKRYPDGKTYPSIFPIGQQRTLNTVKRRAPKKPKDVKVFASKEEEL